MDAEVQPHRSFEGVFQVFLEEKSPRLATLNLSPGRNVYGERLVRISDAEYRLWDPFRSKLAGAILKGLKHLPIKLGSRVLYLGAASGTTASHVSDIVGNNGYVYCVEFAPRSIRDLINNVCKYRGNMAPILADARIPSQYSSIVQSVNAIYCDVAQPEQAKLLVSNARLFLEKEGWAMLAIKSRSIDVTMEPSEVYRQEINVLKENGFVISEVVRLEPYDKDHVLVVAKYMSRSQYIS
ncbi:fibrillarin-like rRNA/tRNA 2'-O-methyltransferase [Candidatus Bathyarchaeota archaeon]|nr:fibrillarin-like rRNA/tRNA 2'-O-methyltransferase [Candidatus Bathyarchaeota archaeon]